MFIEGRTVRKWLGVKGSASFELEELGVSGLEFAMRSASVNTVLRTSSFIGSLLRIAFRLLFTFMTNLSQTIDICDAPVEEGGNPHTASLHEVSFQPALGHVFQGFLDFFISSNEVGSVVRTDLFNVSSPVQTSHERKHEVVSFQRLGQFKRHISEIQAHDANENPPALFGNFSLSPLYEMVRNNPQHNRSIWSKSYLSKISHLLVHLWSHLLLAMNV